MRERTLFLSAIVGIVLIAAGFAVASQANVMPAVASTRAVAVDQLFRILLGVSTVIFLLVEGALVFAVLRFRRTPGDDRPGPAIHGNTSLEILWTLIPAAIVVVIGVYSFQVLAAIEVPGLSPRVVEVVGRQFSWQFRYPEADLRDDRASPSGRTARGFSDLVGGRDPLLLGARLPRQARRHARPDLRAVDDPDRDRPVPDPLRRAVRRRPRRDDLGSGCRVTGGRSTPGWRSSRRWPTNRRQIFLTMGCGACHTLAAAGTTGHDRPGAG